MENIKLTMKEDLSVEIYNFDKEQDLENGIDIKPVNMDELVKIRMENASENNNENIEMGLSLIENKEKDD